MFTPSHCHQPDPLALPGEWGGLLTSPDQIVPGLHAAIYARTYWDPIIFISPSFNARCVCQKTHRYAHVRRTGPVPLRSRPEKPSLLKIKDTLKLSDYGIITARHGWHEDRKACIIAFDW